MKTRKYLEGYSYIIQFLSTVFQIKLLGIILLFSLTHLHAQQAAINFGTYLGTGNIDQFSYSKVINGETYVVHCYTALSGFYQQQKSELFITKFDAACNEAYTTSFGIDGTTEFVDLEIENDNLYLLTSASSSYPTTCRK